MHTVDIAVVNYDNCYVLYIFGRKKKEKIPLIIVGFRN